MVYFSPDGNTCIIHCSCGDSGSGDPSISICYHEHEKQNWPPELALYARDGHYEPTLRNRIRAAWETLCGTYPQWPGMMLMLGGNEQDSEVGCVRALAKWLNDQADRFERDTATDA